MQAMNILLDKNIVSIMGVSLLIGVHLLSGKQKWWQFFEAHGWISFSAGSSVAYVFIHVFPEIAVLQQQFSYFNLSQHGTPFLNQPLYLVLLIGVCLPYMLDTVELHYSADKKQIYQSIYLVRKLLYTLYNFMVGYMLVNRHSEGILSMKMMVIVLVMHFIVLNANFKEIYPALFRKQIRWFAIFGLVLGAALGLTIVLPDYVLSCLFALIGGTLTYIALKQELPKTNHRSPFHFLLGVICFSVLILSIPYFGQAH